MLERTQRIFTEVLPRVISSSVINGYFAAKSFFTGQATPSTATTDFATKTVKDTAFETVRVGLNHAADCVPGGKIVKGVARTAADMTTKGAQAGFEGKSISKTVAKNGFYALNTVACSPLGPAGPVVAYGAGFVTDCLVEKTADNMEFAYTNYKYANEHREYQLKYAALKEDMVHERVVDLEDSFILLKSAAPAA